MTPGMEWKEAATSKNESSSRLLLAGCFWLPSAKRTNRTQNSARALLENASWAFGSLSLKRQAAALLK